MLNAHDKCAYMSLKIEQIGGSLVVPVARHHQAMARHSAYNKEPALTACGTSLLPFRTSCKGPVNTGKVPHPSAQLVRARQH